MSQDADTRQCVLKLYATDLANCAILLVTTTQLISEYDAGHSPRSLADANEAGSEASEGLLPALEALATPEISIVL